MFPVLFSLGRIQIYSYGLMVALALLLGIIWVGLAAQQRKIATFNQITDFAIYVIVGGLVFAKLLYVICEFETYKREPLAIFSGSAGSFFGAVIGGVLLGVYYTKKAQISTWHLADVIALYIPLGHMIGRVGCLLSGCCYGVETDLAWAMRCSSADDLLRHPTQIYEMIGNLLLFIVLWISGRRVEERKERYFPGFIFWLYVGLYSFLRIIIEAFRDSQILAFGWLRTTQVFSLLVAVVVFLYIGYRLKKKLGNERCASSTIHS